MTTPNFKKFNIEAYKPGKSKVKKLKKIYGNWSLQNSFSKKGW